ncbi:hypothetical protein ACIPSE_38530 [Streptomyces sp. NPDC090106]|uniref:hypothetical protein n=1 Tax=Streptomyces sp. NPDC090106 TaxID=3365946 RepID=UPI003812E903
MPSPVRVLGLAVLLSSTLVPVASAAEGWSAAPAGGARPSFYAEGGPGTVLQDTLALTNPTGRPVDVTLRAEGARVTFAGTGSGVRLAAHARTEVPFTVVVPAGDTTARIVARAGDGRTRAVPLHLRAAVPALSALTVEHLTVHSDRLTYELVNRGTTALSPRLAVRADGVLGPVLDRAPRALPVELAPGSRTELSEPWDRPALDAVEIRLTVTAPGGAHDTATASARTAPWGAAAVLAGTAATGGALIVLRRRRSSRARRREARGAEPLGGEVELTGAVS